MAKYLYAYHGGGSMAEASKEEQDKVMQAWIGWFGQLGAAVVDGGNPVGKSTTVKNGSVVGNGGANRLSGGDGNDMLSGAGGADTIFGGAGIDTADYSTSSAGVSITISTSLTAAPAGTGGDAAGDLLLADVENLIGSALTDTLNGNQFANTIRSGAGNDILRGGNSADILVVEGSGTKQLFGDGIGGEPAGSPADGVDTYVVASGASGLAIINDYTFSADTAQAEDIVLAVAPTRAISGTVGGQAALILDGPTFDLAILLNGTNINTALAIVNANLTIDTDFFN